MRDVKSRDLGREDAVELLSLLNPDKVRLLERYGEEVIISDDDPGVLTYPGGWHFSKGYFRNWYEESDDRYIGVPMLDSKGRKWEN